VEKPPSDEYQAANTLAEKRPEQKKGRSVERPRKTT
jgi:hypothetical protein